MVVSAVSGHIGAALAVGVFATLSAQTVGWSRLAIAATIMLAWRRPWHICHRDAIKTPVLFGLILGGVVLVFYFSIQTIPLGASMAIHFLGPISLAVCTGRTMRTGLAATLAILGVFLLSWIGIDLHAPGVLAGIGFAVAGAALWIAYILLGKKLANESGLDGLAVALGFAAVFYLPLAGGELRTIALHPQLLLTLTMVAILSTVMSYTIDQIVLPIVPASTYSLLTALSPATALIVGVVMLAQIPSLGELGGLIAISIAVVLATKPAADIQSSSSSTTAPAAKDRATSINRWLEEPRNANCESLSAATNGPSTITSHSLTNSNLSGVSAISCSNV